MMMPTRVITGLASEETKEVLLVTSELSLKLGIQPLPPIHSALDILPEWVRWVTFLGTILVPGPLNLAFLHLLNDLM